MNPNAGDGAKPWNIPQPQPGDGANDGTGPGGKIVEAAGGALEGAGEIGVGALEVVEGGCGCLGGLGDGCSGCSLAILITLFAAGTAMAVFG